MAAAKVATNIRLDPDLLEGMRRARQHLGIPVSELIRRAIQEYLERVDTQMQNEKQQLATQTVKAANRLIYEINRAAKIPGAARPNDKAMLGELLELRKLAKRDLKKM